MKKSFLLLIVCILCLSGCSSVDYAFDYMTDEVIASLGKYDSKEYYTSGGFQDYTDYAKYKYDDVDLEDNPYLKPLTDESRTEFLAYLADFESWVKAIKETDPQNELVTGYDFSTDIITDDDYFCVWNDPEYPDFGNYDIYFFDTGSSTLYFFHNNI